MYLSEDAILEISKNAVAAGTGDTQNGNVHDMAGFDGAYIVAHLGAVTATGVATLQVNESANSDGSAGTVSGTTVTGSTSNKLLILDIRNPSNRYLQPQLARATANIVINSILVLKYKNKTGPVTQSSDVTQLAKILGI